MHTPELDIDDIICHKLTGQQIKVAFLIAYGKYTISKIAQYCQAGETTIYNWQKDEYFQIALKHFKLIELYHCRDEYTELRKAVIASSTTMLDLGFSGDMVTFTSGIQALNDLLSIYKPPKRKK